MSGVVLEKVSKSFGAVRAVDAVDLAIAPGEFVALVGPSGCGKTTLMRMVAGLERADGGAIRIGEREVTAIRAADRDVAMVFQSYALYPHMNVRANMALPLAMRRLSVFERLPLIGRRLPGSAARHAAIAADVEQAAASLGLSALLDRRPAELSGGQRQRVALGRAIVRRPLAFLMDEPLSNLDAALRVHTRKEIVDIHRRVGASTIYVTHDQEEALTMADRVAVMHAGRILQVAPPEAVYDDPADLTVARFIGSPKIVTLAAEVDGGGRVTVAGAGVGLATRARGPVVYAVRPEALAPVGEGGWPVRIEHVEFLGGATLLHAVLEATGERLIARVGPGEARDLAADGRIRLAPRPGAGLLFGADEKRLETTAETGLDPARVRAHG